MEREKIHALVDAVLDITEGGKGDKGYPYASFSVSNYGEDINVTIKDKGFEQQGGIRGDYDFHMSKEFEKTDNEMFGECIDHIERLKKKVR